MLPIRSLSIRGLRPSPWAAWRPLPRRAACLACGIAPGDPFCGGCADDFVPAGAVRCPRCAVSLAVPAPAGCGACLARPPRFDATMVLGDYRPPLSVMVRALKSGARLDVGAALGHLLATRAAGRVAPGAWVVPVPLADDRLRRRGFNQALEIARPVARSLRLPLVPEAVVRRKPGRPQQGLDRRQRRANVRGAFAATLDLDRRDLVLVDDVMTTGATLDALAAAVRERGARRITILALARTT